MVCFSDALIVYQHQIRFIIFACRKDDLARDAEDKNKKLKEQEET